MDVYGVNMELRGNENVGVGWSEILMWNYKYLILCAVSTVIIRLKSFD